MMIIIAIVILLFVIFSIFKTNWPTNLDEFKWEVGCIFHAFMSNIEDNTIGLISNRVATYKRDSTIAVLTGGNRGIGLKVLEKLLECEMTVILAVRNIEAARKSIEDNIKCESMLKRIIYLKCDISDMKSVKDFAQKVQEKYSKINLLINNAGILAVPHTITKDGFELQMAANHIGHFYLSHLLMPQLIAGGESSDFNSRIVNVSSCAHFVGKIDYKDFNNSKYYNSGMAYADSKLAQILSTRELNKICKKNDWKVQVNACHPGVVDTEIFQNSLLGSLAFIRRLIFKTPEQGARSIVFTAIDPSLEIHGGTYVSNCRIAKISKNAKDPDECEKFFKFSCDLLKIKNFGDGLERKGE